MKRILISIALGALFLSNSSFADSGTIVSGAAPSALAGQSSSQEAYYVNITNQDTVSVFLTMYLDAKTQYGPAYQPISTGEWHVGFNPPASFINMQVACYPGGPAKASGNFSNMQRFVIPPGICSAAAKKEGQ